MVPSLSWIESSDLTKALARAGLSGGGAPAVRRAPVVARAAAPVPAQVPMAGSFGPAAATLPPRAPQQSGTGTDFQPPDGRLEQRLDAFVAWVIEQTQCSRVFVVDDEGLVLCERNADQDMIAISSTFMNLLHRVQHALESGTHGSIAIDLEGGQVLQLVQAQNILGSHVLGFVVTAAVDRALVQRFRKGLSVAMGEDESIFE